MKTIILIIALLLLPVISGASNWVVLDSAGTVFTTLHLNDCEGFSPCFEIDSGTGVTIGEDTYPDMPWGIDRGILTIGDFTCRITRDSDICIGNYEGEPLTLIQQR